MEEVITLTLDEASMVRALLDFVDDLPTGAEPLITRMDLDDYQDEFWSIKEALESKV